MPQETDGTALLSLIWLACIYWSIWSAFSQLSELDENAAKRLADGGMENAGAKKSCEPDPGAAAGVQRRQDKSIAEAMLDEALQDIRRSDPSFAWPDFIRGAAATYEAVTAAFANGDAKALTELTSGEVSRSLLAIVEERRRRGETVETIMARVDAPEVIGAGADESGVEIAVRFSSLLFRTMRNAAGSLVGGEGRRPVEAVDVWTFAKAPGEGGWKVVATNAV